MSYTVPSGTSLGEVLGIQFSDAPGIATKQNPDRTWELLSWPADLGPRPTQQQVTDWATAQLTAKPDRIANQDFTQQKMLRAFAQALKVQFPALNLAQLANDTKTAYKSL